MLRRLSLRWLGSYEACRDRGRGLSEGRNGRGWGVMAAGTGAGMTARVRGTTEVGTRGTRPPVTPAAHHAHQL